MRCESAVDPPALPVLSSLHRHKCITPDRRAFQIRTNFARQGRTATQMRRGNARCDGFNTALSVD